MSGYPIDRRIKHATKNAFKADKIPVDSTYFYIDTNGDLSLQNLPSFSVGDYLYSANSSITGFLKCDGSAISRTTYSALFVVIGTSFGNGDGSTTFNLPDARSRVLGAIGQGSGLTNRTIGNAIGEENHTLTVNEIPSHQHLLHQVGVAGGGGYGLDGNYSAGSNLVNTGPTGGNNSHNNIQPTLFAGNVFIKF